MYNENCKYCTQNENLTKLMIPICDLDHSKLYLFKEQSNLGRCVLAYKGHINEYFDLSEKETAGFAKDMHRVGKAIKAAFGSDKVNYGMFNDTGDHLHCHIVPKYRGGYQFDGMFVMLPQPGTYLSDEEYAQVIEKLKANL